MTPPAWFVKDLEIIDPSYFIVYNEDYEYWEIKKRMEVDRKDEVTKVRIRLKNPTVAVFKSLNDDALLSIRRRKYIGLQYKQDTLSYMKDIKKSNKEAREKAKQIAREMMAEGFLRIHNLDRKKIYT